MDFGFGIPMRGPLANVDSISEIVTSGEGLGFDIVTVSDHVVVPRHITSIYPYNEDGSFAGQDTGECLEQLTTLMAIAAITNNLRLLTSVMVLPHRNPVLTAKILATIDVLSKGRLNVGCGVGWMREEFEALAAPSFDERGAVGSEYIQIFKELWTKDDPVFEGNFASFSNISFLPKPVQTPHPPIWVGGESSPALRRAVELGDCWYPIGTNPKFPLDSAELLRKRIDRLHHYAEANNRDPATIDLAYSANWFNMGSQSQGNRTRWFEGESNQIQEDVGQLMDLGVNHLILSFTGESTSEITDNMSKFISEVATNIPK
jgi:probable F420-dependent oxidoreductase|tara:strand:- start:1013 stop:1966 length:954 start_codon:yes stop_codon:yes gene_type:complete